MEAKKVPAPPRVGPLVAGVVGSDHGWFGLGDNMACHIAFACTAVWGWLRCAPLACFADLLLRNLFCSADLALRASWGWAKLLVL